MNPIEISEAFGALVEKNASFVVAVDARPAGSSGVVTSADGVVVTAEHTVDRESALGVRLHDGREVPATLIGRDPATGLAALRAEATGLPFVEWGALEGLKVGHLVLSLTRPGRTIRASLGMVHALGNEPWRTPAGGQLDRYLQADLSLQRGLSGGLLVDAGGRALGLNNAGLMRGAALVVPGATVKRVLDSLLAHGCVRRGFLGVGAYPVQLPAAIAAEAGQPIGLLLISVQAQGPAERAGLMLGDALLSLDGQPVADLGQLQSLLGEEKIGHELAARVLRAGKIQDVKVTVGARP